MSKLLALEARSVSKRFGRRRALCGVDLVVEPGQIHGLLGPNGAGKTTLLRILLGLVGRDAGTIRVFGGSLESTSGCIPDGVAGFVDTPAFYPYLSGRGNLELLARLDGRPSSNAVNPGHLGDRIARVLAEVDLSAQADTAVSSYSAGMRQRLGLAAVLLRSPRLALLDEPTSSLDPRHAREVRTLARRLASDGAAVVLSSHDLAEVDELCSVITVIDHGHVVYSGPVDELRARVPTTAQLLRTSDDEAALAIAHCSPGIRAALAANDGFEVWGNRQALDAYVIALGCAGIAIRALAHRSRSLESLFLELTGPARAFEAPVADLPEDILAHRAEPTLP